MFVLFRGGLIPGHLQCNAMFRWETNIFANIASSGIKTFFSSNAKKSFSTKIIAHSVWPAAKRRRRRKREKKRTVVISGILSTREWVSERDAIFFDGEQNFRTPRLAFPFFSFFRRLFLKKVPGIKSRARKKKESTKTSCQSLTRSYTHTKHTHILSVSRLVGRSVARSLARSDRSKYSYRIAEAGIFGQGSTRSEKR